MRLLKTEYAKIRPNGFGSIDAGQKNFTPKSAREIIQKC